MTFTLHNLRSCLLALVFLTLATFHGLAWSQDPVIAEFQPISSLEELLQQAEAGKDKTELQSGLNDIEKADLLNSYINARSALQSAQGYRAKEQEYQRIIETNPGKVRALKKSIEKLQKAKTTRQALPKPKTLPEAQQELIGLQSGHAALESQLVEMQHRLDELKTRPARARDQLTQARKALLELGNQLIIISGTSESTQQQDAHKLRLQAQRMAREIEIKMLEQELLSHPAQTSLLGTERELLQQRFLLSKERLRDTEAFVSDRGQAEARAAQEQSAIVEEQASGKHPEILRIAAENAELSQEQLTLAEKLAKMRATQEKHEKQAKQIEQDFRGSKQRLEIGGLSDASGQFMSNERQKLPDLRQYLKAEKRLRKKIRKAGIAQLQLDEKSRKLDDIEGLVEETIEQKVNTGLSDQDKAELRSELTVLLDAQKELLKRGSESYSNYIRALNTLDFTHKRLVETSNQYGEFIDEHLLWIPSAEPVSSTTLKNLGDTLTWITSPENWRGTGRILINEMVLTPWMTGFFIILFVGLLAIHSSLHAAVNRVAEHLRSPYSDRFQFTLQALVATLLIALPLPILFAYSGWRLGLSEEHLEFAKAVSSGLSRIAVPLFLLQIFLNLCKPQGVAAQHLHWDAHTVAILRKNLFWLMLLVVPLIFVSTITKTATDSSYYSSLGRLSLLFITIAQSTFVYLVLHPVRGAPKNTLERNPKGWLMTLRHIWFPLIFLWPLTVAAVALIGYQYTAVKFMELFMQSFWLVLGMLILHDIIVRWLLISNRKLALIMAREKREAEKSAEKITISGEGLAQANDAPKAEVVEFAELSEQTRALLRILFWMATAGGIIIIWSSVFPALSVLENIPLWQTSFLTGDKQVLHTVTLAHLAKAIILTIVVIAAAKNLPGVMEMIVLRHMNLERGSRYAIMTITRYLIIVLGFLVIFNIIGGRWSEIQWLVAALGVGLGFGLQEIVANFISGIILLFERPIRIGDTVTVGEVTGVVTRIQIRATTIRDMDRKELLVPNKLFITDQMINWSLSDPINRVVIPVGVAYGSDTKLAHQVMLDTVRSLPLILKEPQPSVFFVGFGDSSLDFEVRVFVKSYEDRFASLHGVHMELEKALRKHNIEIPFPQRDIHIKGVED